MDKISARFITITPVEGRIGQPGPVTLAGPTAWTSARHTLALMAAFNGLGPDMLGFLKTDFTIEWADGETYEGTFGLTDTDHDLAAHVRGFLTHTRDTILARPRLEATASAFTAYLDTYLIGDLVS